jgi:glycosyltransferase involved in cell wall biosynthesis
VSIIAVITADVLSERMAGPAIRAWQIAQHLAAAGHEVTLASTARSTVSHPEVRCLHASGRRLRAAVARADVVIVQGYVTYQEPWLLGTDQVLVVDLYDPLHFEQLEQLRERPLEERHSTMDLTVRVINEQLARGDLFLCASVEQRTLWLGQLGAFGRINAENYDRDHSLESLIMVCPFGLADQAPVHTRAAIRGVVDGIGVNDKLLIWAGGVYNWFDPLTLLRAVDALRADHADVRLYFLGMTHPNPDIPDMRIAWQTRELADELGLTGTHVFFNDGWVDYDDRANYLLEADAGVSTHFQHVETTFSFRTRILDYFWADLPVVCTGGDTLGRVVAEQGLGVAVSEADTPQLVEALKRVLYDDEFARECRANVARVAKSYTWSNALASLIAFCESPRRAADHDTDLRRMVRRPVVPQSVVARRLLRARVLLREGGPSLLAERIQAYRRRQRGGAATLGGSDRQSSHEGGSV